MSNKINRKYKDSTFRYLFSDPNNFVDLYKEVSGEEIDPEKLIFRDTSSIIESKDYLNDVSFLTSDNNLVIMVEHQSSLNENMALRLLIYYVSFLEMYIKENKLNLHSYKAIKVPNVEFYVVYNGVGNVENSKISLSENFTTKHKNINLEVTVKDIGFSELKNQDDKNNFTGYCYFIDSIKKYEKNETDKNTIFKLAKKDCLDNGYLVDYLNKKEFLIMALERYTIEMEMQNRYEQGREEVREEVREKDRKIVKNLLEMKMEIKDIAKVTNLLEEEIIKIKNDINS